ncbi:hypothetical protein [Persephonella sp.]
MVRSKEDTIKDLSAANRKTLGYYARVGAPYYFLPEKIREWLENGGLEKLKKEKPITAELIEGMDKDIHLPLDLGITTKFTRQIENKMREKGYLKEDEIVHGNEVYEIFVFKRDPLQSTSDKMYRIAQTGVELLEEKIKEDPNREDIKKVRDIFKSWYLMNRKIREARGKDV